MKVNLIVGAVAAVVCLALAVAWLAEGKPLPGEGLVIAAIIAGPGTWVQERSKRR